MGEIKKIEFLVRLSFDTEYFDWTKITPEYVEKMLKNKLNERGIDIKVGKAGNDGLLNIPLANAEIWIEEINNKLVINAGDPDDADLMDLKLYREDSISIVKNIKALEIIETRGEENE